MLVQSYTLFARYVEYLQSEKVKPLTSVPAISGLLTDFNLIPDYFTGGSVFVLILHVWMYGKVYDDR